MKRYAGLTGALIVVMCAFVTGKATAEPCEYRGENLSGWEVVVGDGIYTAPGQAPVELGDISTEHFDGYSELRANVQRRQIMAHNITFKRVINKNALKTVYTCSFKFRLPYLPTVTNVEQNAQTLEAGMFVWDGQKTRLDYGTAFQWVLNPWVGDFGNILCWTDEEGGKWKPEGHLTPDTEWHEAWIKLDFPGKNASLKIDGKEVPVRFTGISKASSWGTEIAARLQVEIVSLYPGESGAGALHRAEVKDWTWSWTRGK